MIGARDYSDGKTRKISGLAAPDPLTVRITLTRSAPDFVSILALPFFAPVPRVHAAKSSVGEGYSRRVVGSEPYTLRAYAPVVDRAGAQRQLGPAHRPAAQGMGGQGRGHHRQRPGTDPANTSRRTRPTWPVTPSRRR